MSKIRLDLFNNDWYHPGAGTLKRTFWYFTNVIFFKNGWLPFSGIRIQLLRLFGAKVGKGVVLKPCVNIKSPWRLEIGDHCWIGENVWIDNLVLVRIERQVCLSQGAFLLTGNHNYKDPAFGLMTGEIHLAEGVWIGAQSIVCPGITCQEGSVLSAGSVATQNLQSWGIYQGNPAIFKKNRILNE
jgi:putative colanic acid biosynthesis acetyltransferase WcaF